MKKLLIIRTGKAVDIVIEKLGDFHDCIINGAGIAKEKVMLWNVFEDITPPDLEEVSAIIITGSHSMVTAHEAWSDFLAKWLRENVGGDGDGNGGAGSRIPTLGICYGHQLLAEAFGGAVGFHPDGMEIGTTSIKLTEDGKNDPLFGVLPEEFHAHVIHSQSVTKLPTGAVLLAKDSFEPYPGFRINNNIWGVQFHPEFTAPYISLCIELLKDDLIKNGRDFEAIEKSVREHNYGSMLLKRFLELAE